MTTTPFEKGQAIRRAVLGDAHVDRAEQAFGVLPDTRSGEVRISAD